MTKRYLAIFCTIFWAGLIAGISFLEAPLKFQAPGITVPLGLGIGQLVFQALNKIEIVLLLIIALSIINSPLKNLNGILLFLIISTTLIDTFWLLPILDERAKLILSGALARPGHHHILYIAIEIIKFLSLCSFGFLNLKDLPYENRPK